MNQSRCMTLGGFIDIDESTPIDAHNHLWIGWVADAAAGSPLLTHYGKAQQELLAFKDACTAAGLPIGVQVDCQPGGFGRHALLLHRLFVQTGVPIVACTGFHLRRYSPQHWLWNASFNSASDFFVRELTQNMQEVPDDEPLRAGFIKIAFEVDAAATPPTLLDAVADAVARTQCAVQIHTERGAAALEILALLAQRAVPLQRVILCHMDKRPDVGLHRELIAQGVMLEYDTFFRPKYDPEKNVWILLREMIEKGHANHIVLAMDMADTYLWTQYGGTPGMAGFIHALRARLLREDFPPAAVQQLVGGNIVQRLARPMIN